MSFEQFKLDRSIGTQNRDIFNQYIYETDDTISQVLSPDYFSESRFISTEPDKWKGSIISLKAFDGFDILQLSEDGSTASSALTAHPANEIVINKEEDFDVQDATTITLEDNKVYLPGANITTSKRFIVGKNVSIFFRNILLWTYTGTGDMFTGVDVETFLLFRPAFACPNAQMFNISDTTPQTSAVLIDTQSAFSVPSSTLVAEKYGTFTDLDRVLISFSDLIGPGVKSLLGMNDGITIAGSNLTILSIDRLAFLSFDASFVGLDLGSTVVTAFFGLSNFVNVGMTGGSIGISGLTNDGNIGTGVTGSIENCEFIGPITPLSGLSESDLQIEINNSSPIPNSTKTADSYLTALQLVTISSSAVFVPIAGTNWVSDVSERFSTTTAGLITYLTPVSSKGQVTIIATVEKATGGADEIQLGIAINGTVVAKTIVGTEDNSPSALTSIGIFTFEANDTIQAYVANDTGTADINVLRCSVNITNGF